MKILAVLFLVMGLGAIFSHYADRSGEEPGNVAVATNFLLYRNAVLEHVRNTGGVAGDIPIGALALPLGWQAIWNRPWRARVENGICYVYGQCSRAEALAVRDMMGGSFALGVARNGRLAPAPVNGQAISLPAFIPAGSLVSVTGGN